MTTTDAEARIAGIVSTDPYCVMNSPHRRPELTNEWHPPIALLGRVPARVVGKITAGDIMVASDTPGFARAWTEDSNPPAGSVVGKAVQSKADEGEGEIEIVCGRV